MAHNNSPAHLSRRVFARATLIAISAGLAMSAAILLGHAQDARPVPADGKCPVPADTQRWTPQEVFVWQRVCVGKTADFEIEPGYGGVLDPKKPDRWPKNRTLTSRFLETILLKEEYRRAITRLGVRIEGALFDEPIELENATLRHELSLIRSVLARGANFKGLKSSAHVILDGSKVSRLLNMSGAEIGFLSADRAEFDRIALIGARTRGDVTFIGTKVTDTLDMDSLHVGKDLFMRDGAEFIDVDLRGANIRDQLSMSDSKVRGRLNMDALVVGQSLFMEDGEFNDVDLLNANVGVNAHFSNSTVNGTLDLDGFIVKRNLLIRRAKALGEVRLRSANIGGRLDFHGSTISGPLRMDRIVVAEYAWLRGRGNFADIALRGARIAGQLEIVQSRVDGTLILDSAEIGGNAILREGSTFADINFNNATVGGQLDLSGSTVRGKLNLNSVRIGTHLFMRQTGLNDVDLATASIRGQLNLEGAKVAGRFHAHAIVIEGTAYFDRGAEFRGPINLVFSKVRDNLNLGGGKFHADVDMSQSHIGGELRLRTDKNESAQWIAAPEPPLLRLRNARADVIPDASDAWPEKLDLMGFAYRGVNGIQPRAQDTKESDEPHAEMVTGGVGSLPSWFLRAISPFERWLEKQEFALEPYEQLARVLHNHGHIEKATSIRYVGKERERAAATGFRYAWLTVLDVLIGYGYHLDRAVYWTFGMVLLGVAVLRASGQGPANRMPYGIAYSFDMLLPVIRLREQHYKIDLEGWARQYFYFHKVAGYMLASFLIVGISGLAK